MGYKDQHNTNDMTIAVIVVLTLSLFSGVATYIGHDLEIGSLYMLCGYIDNPRFIVSIAYCLDVPAFKHGDRMMIIGNDDRVLFI